MSLWRALKLCACVVVSRRSRSRTARQGARSANVGVGISVDHVDYQNFKLLDLSDRVQEDSLTVAAQGSLIHPLKIGLFECSSLQAGSGLKHGLLGKLHRYGC